MNELCTKGAGELAGIIALGAVSSSEVIEAHLARIEEVNPDLNAATATLADEAREAAAAVDRSVAAGEAREATGHPLSIQRTMSAGPMARRVADLRLALGILSAPDARDPRWVPAPLDGPAIDGPVRVAVVRDPLGAGIDPQVRAG